MSKTTMGHPISPNDRVRWLEMLQFAAESKPGSIDDNWKRLLDELDVEPNFTAHVITAVRERRWQNAENPLAYVKTVACRLAYKAEVESNQGARLIYPSSGPGLLGMQSSPLQAESNQPGPSFGESSYRQRPKGATGCLEALRPNGLVQVTGYSKKNPTEKRPETSNSRH